LTVPGLAHETWPAIRLSEAGGRPLGNTAELACGLMRDLWVFLAVVLGALGVGVLGDGENWFGDRVVLVEISYLFGAS
jgi:hypothetical protein